MRTQCLKGILFCFFGLVLLVMWFYAQIFVFKVLYPVLGSIAIIMIAFALITSGVVLLQRKEEEFES